MDEAVFRFVYHEALRDATLEKAYQGEKKRLFENIRAQDILRAYADRIIANQLTEKDFEETQGKIEASYAEFLTDGSAPFTFGNTQKLINMTAKYLYISAYGQPRMRDRFRLCHCPMDSRIVNRVIKALDATDRLQLRLSEKEELDRLTRRGFKTYLRQPWSRITSADTAQYELFQRAVRFLSKQKGVFPIEYDYLFW